jgi:hypothetical protein
LKEKKKIEFVHANILNASHGFTFANAARKLDLPYILTARTYIFLPPIEMYCNLPELVPCKKPFPNARAHACSEIGVKWFLFFFCLSAFDVDLFDRQIFCVEADTARRSKIDVRLKTAPKSPKRNKYHF